MWWSLGKCSDDEWDQVQNFQIPHARALHKRGLDTLFHHLTFLLFSWSRYSYLGAGGSWMPLFLWWGTVECPKSDCPHEHNFYFSEKPLRQIRKWKCVRAYKPINKLVAIATVIRQRFVPWFTFCFWVFWVDWSMGSCWHTIQRPKLYCQRAEDRPLFY